MREIVKDRLKTFTNEESQTLKGSYDFLGLNYYTGRYAKDISSEPISVVSYNTDYQVSTLVNGVDGKVIGESAGSAWLYVYPPGMRKVLNYIKVRYNDPIIYITENGFDEVNDPKLTIREARRDEKRISYISDHLKAIKQAMEIDKVKVQGYFTWSFIDNFEWQDGYTVRFGMIHVDYNKSYARYPKLSALWYMNFLNKGDPNQAGQQTISGIKRPISDNGDESATQKAPKRKVIYKV